jgi:DNA-binding protein H-NS
MARTYLEIQAQIRKLQEEAEKLRNAERAETVEKIKVAIAAFGLTPADLFGSRRPSAKAASGSASKNGGKPVASPRKKQGPRRVAIKYRDGANEWSGRGSQPKWLAAAIAGGKKIEQFRV